MIWKNSATNSLQPMSSMHPQHRLVWGFDGSKIEEWTVSILWYLLFSNGSHVSAAIGRHCMNARHKAASIPSF